MKHLNKIIGICLLAICVLAPSALATETGSLETTIESADAKLIEEKFPEGIPDFLSEAEVESIMNGEYLAKQVDGTVYHYNPENKPGQISTFASDEFNVVVEWDEDMSKDHVWYPKFAQLNYNKKGLSDLKSEMMFRVGLMNPSVANVNLHGRAWTEMKASNGATEGDQSEEVYVSNSGERRIKIVVTIPTAKYAERASYAYRNLTFGEGLYDTWKRWDIT